MDDLSGRHIQGSEQCGDAVPLVVMGQGARSPLLQWEAGLCPVQRLDLTLLVEGEDDGPFGRGNVEAYHVADLLDEARISGKLEVSDPMRFQPVSGPDGSVAIFV